MTQDDERVAEADELAPFEGEIARKEPPDWSDLSVRFGVAAVMAVLGLAAMWVGGWTFRIVVAALCALMIWETARMLSHGPAVRPLRLPPSRRAAKPARSWAPLVLAGTGGLALVLVFVLPPGWALPLVLIPGLAGLRLMRHNRTILTTFCTGILLAGWGLADLRTEYGFGWMMWLAAVVIATDVFGYFAGKQFGGPKFWPRVSPKKTWAGTIAGWAASAVVGALWWVFGGADSQIIGISVAISMASQMGDISESAVKRKMGVKDSSALLPGHGGVFDRFDGMLGAALLLLFVEALIGFPPTAAGLADP